MRTLALDLGTKTGWAVRMPEGNIVSGRENFHGDRFEGGGMRWVRFQTWLRELHAKTQCQIIVFEEVRNHKGISAAHAYGGFLATLTAFCENIPLPYSSIPVVTIKRFITGKGNANKEAVIKAVQAKGFTPLDDNEADAISILLCAEAQTARVAA